MDAPGRRCASCPGHTDETTIGRECEHNPFVRVWRGAEPEGTRARSTVGGREATLVVWSPDYDGKGKAWVRFDDGADAIVGGSRVAARLMPVDAGAPARSALTGVAEPVSRDACPKGTVGCGAMRLHRRPLRGRLLRPPQRRPARGDAAADAEGGRLRARPRRRRRLQAAELDDAADRVSRTSGDAARRAQARRQDRGPARDPARRGARATSSTTWARRPRSQKDGVERDLQEAARGRARGARRGASARAARVADRRRPGRPDVPRRRRRLGRGRDQAHRRRSTRSSS